MNKVLTFPPNETNEQKKNEKYSIIDIQTSMIPYLNDENVETLYRYAKSNWQSEPPMQKKAYKILSTFFSNGKFEQTIGKNPDDLQILMLDSTLVAASAAKKVNFLFYFFHFLIFFE